MVVAGLGAALAVTAPSCRLLRPELVVEDVTRQRLLHHECAGPGSTFVLAYVHSSEHVPVRGVFQISSDRTMRVTETAFAGFGPGLPALAPGDAWRLEDGMIVARPPGAAGMPELLVRVAPITRHTLTTPAGTTMDLSALMGGAGGAVRISVR